MGRPEAGTYNKTIYYITPLACFMFMCGRLTWHLRCYTSCFDVGYTRSLSNLKSTGALNHLESNEKLT